VEWPAERRYVGLVAVGVQQRVEDILFLKLLRNCLILDISFSYSLSPLQNSGPCNSFYCLGLFKNVYDDDDDDDEGTSRRLVRAERRNSDGDDVGRMLVCVCVSGALRRLAESAPTQLN